MTELPEDYIVQCSDAAQTRDVIQILGNPNISYHIGFWKFVIKHPSASLSKLEQANIYNNIRPQFESLPIIQYSYWRKLYFQVEEFPEKWAIERTPENAIEVNMWFNKIAARGYKFTDIIRYLVYPAIDKITAYGKVVPSYKSEIIPSGYKLIDIETFRKITSKMSNNKEEKPKAKITGYKAPFDLFSGDIKAGTVYEPLNIVNNIGYCAVNSKGSPIDSGRTNLPKEIVESWEPVYTLEIKSETVTIGDPARVVAVHSNGNVEISNAKGNPYSYHIDDIRILLDRFNVQVPPWRHLSITPNKLWVGCGEGIAITRDEVQTVIYLYDKLNSTQ